MGQSKLGYRTLVVWCLEGSAVFHSVVLQTVRKPFLGHEVGGRTPSVQFNTYCIEKRCKSGAGQRRARIRSRGGGLIRNPNAALSVNYAGMNNSVPCSQA